MGIRKGGGLPDFEALLKVSVSGGVPMRAEILMVREHRPGPAGHGPRSGRK